MSSAFLRAQVLRGPVHEVKTLTGCDSRQECSIITDIITLSTTASHLECSSCAMELSPILHFISGSLEDSISINPLENTHHHTSTQETPSFRSQPLTTSHSHSSNHSSHTRAWQTDSQHHFASCQPTAGPAPVCLQGQMRNRERCGMSPPLLSPTSGITRQLHFSPICWLQLRLWHNSTPPDDRETSPSFHLLVIIHWVHNSSATDHRREEKVHHYHSGALLCPESFPLHTLHMWRDQLFTNHLILQKL